MLKNKLCKKIGGITMAMAIFVGTTGVIGNTVTVNAKTTTTSSFACYTSIEGAYDTIYSYLCTHVTTEDCTGRDVRILQRCLNVPTTGIFDQATKDASTNFYLSHYQSASIFFKIMVFDKEAWQFLKTELYSIDLGELLRLWNS